MSSLHYDILLTSIRDGNGSYFIDPTRSNPADIGTQPDLTRTDPIRPDQTCKHPLCRINFSTMEKVFSNFMCNLFNGHNYDIAWHCSRQLVRLIILLIKKTIYLAICKKLLLKRVNATGSDPT